MKYSKKLIFENGILAYKKCTKCGEVKDVDRFSKNKTTSTGYASQCKDCFNKRKRDLNNPNIDFGALKKEYPKLGERKKLYKSAIGSETQYWIYLWWLSYTGNKRSEYKLSKNSIE